MVYFYYSPEYTKKDLELLYKQANKFCLAEPEASYYSEFNPFTHLYRDGSYDYFKNIKANGGRMEKTRKDKGVTLAHGDPRSPINNLNEDQRPQGLFFQSNVQYNKDTKTFNPRPLSESEFGSCRIHIKADMAFGEFRHAYFAEFYCLEPGGDHYAT